MRKGISLLILVVFIELILAAGCVNLLMNKMIATPTPSSQLVTVTTTPAPTAIPSAATVTTTTTLSPTCAALKSNAAADGAFLNFVSNSNIMSQINGLIFGFGTIGYDSCSEITPAEQLNQQILSGPAPQSSSLIQARMDLISATTYCQIRPPLSTTVINTETDLGKFANDMNEYRGLLESCEVKDNTNCDITSITVAIPNCAANGGSIPGYCNGNNAYYNGILMTVNENFPIQECRNP